MRLTTPLSAVLYILVLVLFSVPARASDQKGLEPAAAAVSAAAERRVALVIGNGAYVSAPLSNPVNDAKAMARSLNALGFEVIERENVTKSQMEDAVGLFGERLSEDAVGLVYYSGHGIQVAGKNYLIPIDAEIPSEQMVPLRTLDVDLVLTQMTAAHTRVNLLILDACRNNPFERRFRTTAGNGLAQMTAPVGTLVAYATAPGKTASDGSGVNGLYTQELLKAMKEPGLPIEEVFKRVRTAVRRESQDSQTPWEASSLEGSFYFVGIAGQQSVSPPSTSSPAQSLVPPSTSSPAQSLVPTVIGTWRWFNPNSSIVYIRPDGLTIHLANGIRVDAGTWTASENGSIRIHWKSGWSDWWRLS